MIVYLLIIIFFILLFHNQNESFDFFVNYRRVYSGDKEQTIYKGMYKCRDYEDIRLN
jgi:hypothetical protein